MFARPLSLAAAVERLEKDGSGSIDFVPAVSVINMLIEDCALVSLDHDRVSTRAGPIPLSTHACSTTTVGRVITSPLRQAVRPGAFPPRGLVGAPQPRRAPR